MVGSCQNGEPERQTTEISGVANDILVAAIGRNGRSFREYEAIKGCQTPSRRQSQSISCPLERKLEMHRACHRETWVR